MACAVLVLQLVQYASAQSLSSQAACTYADSTCSDCGPSLCGSGQLYPLLPSSCHPASQVRKGRGLQHAGAQRDAVLVLALCCVWVLLLGMSGRCSWHFTSKGSLV